MALRIENIFLIFIKNHCYNILIRGKLKVDTDIIKLKYK